jgi:hypothetical protein
MVEQEVLRVIPPLAVEAAMQAHQEMIAQRNAAIGAIENDLTAARFETTLDFIFHRHSYL